MISYRLANSEDVHELDRICRECFPHSIFWSGSHPATRRWWDCALEPNLAETWVAVNDQLPVGLVVTLLDEAGWHRRIGRSRMSGWEFLRRALAEPARLGRWLSKRTKDRAHSEETVEEPAEPGERRLYIEQFAVSPRTQRQGVGGGLVRLSAARAKELKRDAVAYNVDSDNSAMRALLEKEGFRTIRAHAGQLTLSREITADEMQPAKTKT